MAEKIQAIFTTSGPELDRISKLFGSKGYKIEDVKLGVGVGFDVNMGENIGNLEIYPTNSTIHLVFDDTRVELSEMETFHFTKDEELIFQSKKGSERYLVIGKKGEVTFLRGVSGAVYENGLVAVVTPFIFPPQAADRPLQQ